MLGFRYIVSALQREHQHVPHSQVHVCLSPFPSLLLHLRLSLSPRSTEPNTTRSYNNAQESYTNEQFLLSALSLGFSQQHAHQIRGMLFGLFSQRCEAPKPIPYWADPAPQSICIDVRRLSTGVWEEYELTSCSMIAHLRLVRRVGCMKRL